MRHLYPQFLNDDAEYVHARAEWLKVWDTIPAQERQAFDWQLDWFKPQPPNDGNPIFTAVSYKERKAIRVIQYEPTVDTMEIDFWLDTFGGSAIEPAAIRQLVIACALSDESAARASALMSAWVSGELELINHSDSEFGAANIRGVAAKERISSILPITRVET